VVDGIAVKVTGTIVPVGDAVSVVDVTEPGLQATSSMTGKIQKYRMRVCLCIGKFLGFNHNPWDITPWVLVDMVR
jgi:hypothetical protein